MLEELPNDHRPDDQWIAARLQIDHEFRKRLFASVQRKFKRNFQGGMGTGYSTSDEVWSHFKPTEEQLEKWIREEDRGEKRIDEQSALRGDAAESSDLDSNSSKDGEVNSRSDAGEEQRVDDIEAKTASRSGKNTASSSDEDSSRTLQNKDRNETTGPAHNNVSASAAGEESYDAPQNTWLGMPSALRDGPSSS
jgi:platelet-activating factor acetylhydrolase